MAGVLASSLVEGVQRTDGPDAWSAWVLKRLAAVGMLTFFGALAAAVVADIWSPYWSSPHWSASVHTRADDVAENVAMVALFAAVGCYSIACCYPWRRIKDRLAAVGIFVFFGALVGGATANGTGHPAVEHFLDHYVVSPLLLGALGLGVLAALPKIVRGVGSVTLSSCALGACVS